MNKIIINRGSFKLDEVVFEQGTTTIGRAGNNTIILDDSAVSTHHAKIVTLFNTSYIEDLDSTNGTLVNGKTAQKRTLHSGDVISLGNHQLLFQSDEASNRVTDETSETVMLNGSEIKQKLSEFIQAQADMQQSHRTTSQETRSPQANKPPSTTQDKDGKTLLKTATVSNTILSNSGLVQPSGEAASLDRDKNRAWLDAKNNRKPAAGLSSSEKEISEKAIPKSAAAAAIVRASDDAQQQQPEIIRNTASAIRDGAGAALPATNTDTAITDTTMENNPGEKSSTQKIPVDIAAAARSALQNRRTNDSSTANQNSAKSGSIKTGPRNIDAKYTDSKTTNSINISTHAYAAKNGAIALNSARSSNKILPVIWLIIAAVLISEVIYITYRSLG